MSIRSIAATVALTVFFGTPMAFATSGFTPDNSEVGGKSHPMPSNKSRVQAQQERAAARADGSLPAANGEIGTASKSKTSAGASESRAKVKSEARQAQAAGTLRQLNRE